MFYTSLAFLCKKVFPHRNVVCLKCNKVRMIQKSSNVLSTIVCTNTVPLIIHIPYNVPSLQCTINHSRLLLLIFKLVLQCCLCIWVIETIDIYLNSTQLSAALRFKEMTPIVLHNNPCCEETVFFSSVLFILNKVFRLLFTS